MPIRLTVDKPRYVRNVEKKAGVRDTSLCETVFHLKNVLQTYKNLPSHQNQDLEKKRTFYTILIIIAALIFSSTFFKIYRFFREFFIFWQVAA